MGLFSETQEEAVEEVNKQNKIDLSAEYEIQNKIQQLEDRVAQLEKQATTLYEHLISVDSIVMGVINSS